MPWNETNQWVPLDAVVRGWAMIGSAVNRRRVALAISQRDLSRRTGISQSVISRLEGGKLRGMRWSRFALLVDALDGLDFGALPTHHWIALDRHHAQMDASGSSGTISPRPLRPTSSRPPTPIPDPQPSREFTEAEIDAWLDAMLGR